MLIDIEASWHIALQHEWKQSYFTDLQHLIKTEYKRTTVYPPAHQIFSAFNLCPLLRTKVVILGQDPYHGAGQAQGLSFSVPDEMDIPPSLRNIFTEIETDVGSVRPESGNLERWAEQGVLLLNATLTVPAGTPGGHQGMGWEQFTDQVIDTINRERENVVFLLWGTYARQKSERIDTTRHCVLTAPHPSPLSAYRGFFGCRHFSQTNIYLEQTSQTPITW